MDDVHKTIREMTEARGFVINSFTQIECLLADLIDQCRDLTQYEELSHKPIPFGVDNRVARVRELTKAGPLFAFADIIDKILTRFMEFEDLRHLFTHGYASVAYTPDGDIGMYFIRYVPPPKGGEVTMVRRFYRPRTIIAQRDSCLEFTESAMQEFRQLYLASGLDPDRLATYDPEAQSEGG
jgi:hypothetical protein